VAASFQLAGKKAGWKRTATVLMQKLQGSSPLPIGKLNLTP
jgi:hypothetical protein